MNLKRVIYAGFFALAALLFASGGSAFGQMSLPQPNQAAIQNFDTIGTSATAPLPNGWRMNVASGPTTSYSQSNTATSQSGGTTGTGALNNNSAGGAYNFADGVNASSTDRGIGFLPNSSGFTSPRNMFVQVKNDTGQTVTSFVVSFNYEQYRNGLRGTSMNFYYGSDGTVWNTISGGSQAFAANTDTTAINPPTKTPETYTIPNLNIAPGQVYYLRWEYVENTTPNGGRQAIGIDDVSITPRTAGGGGTTTPTITASTGTLPDFGAVAVGTTSPEKSYTISGSNLTDNIVVTAPPEFLISTTSGEGYTQSVTIPRTGGTVNSTTIYVVMMPTSPGPKSGAVTNSSTGATTQNVSVSGTASQSYTVSGQIIYKGAQPLAGITVTASQNNMVAGTATTDANGNYALSLPGGGNYVLSVATAPFIFAAPQQSVTNLSGNQAVNFSATGAAVLISEFRFHGTTATDEFVELYNNSDALIDISGFALVSSDSQMPKYIVPGDPNSRSTTIPARGHYLITGAGYTLNAYAAGDGALGADIADGAGLGLFINSANVSPAGRIDAVGFAGAGALFAEGTPLDPAGGITTNGETSFVRDFANAGYPADSDNNAADFIFAATDAAIYNGVQATLGAPGPENRQSPVFNASYFTATLLDPAAPANAAPNRVNDPSATNNGFSPNGTISLRRTYTNATSLAVTRLRVRVVGITTIGSRQVYNPQAVDRVLNSADITVTKSDGSTVPVKGLTIETPPNQPQAGGYNTSLIVNLTAPINPGESVNIDTTIGVVQSGRLVINTAVEAVLAAPASTSEHLTLGNPSNAVASASSLNNYLLDKYQYAVGYNCGTGKPNWVSWHLDSTWLGSAPRQNDFRADTTLPAGCYQVQGTDYSGSGFDRGHHTPSADRTDTVADNSATFLMSNMMPQAPDNNQGPWEQLESYCRSLVSAGNEVYIIAGSYGVGGSGSNGGTTNSIAGGHVTVPSQTFKVILVLPVGNNDVSRVNTGTRVIGIIMPNTQGIRNNDWRQYRVSVDQVEAATGLDFFSNVPANIQAAIESTVDNQ